MPKYWIFICLHIRNATCYSKKPNICMNIELHKIYTIFKNDVCSDALYARRVYQAIAEKKYITSATTAICDVNYIE